MSQSHTYIADLFEEAEIPADSILSRALYEDEQLKVVLFRFAAGQELSEHTASKPATIQVLEGEAQLQLGEEPVEAKAGAWIHMPAELPHSVKANTDLVLLLQLIKG